MNSPDAYLSLLDQTLSQIRKYQKQLLLDEGIDLTPDQWMMIQGIHEVGQLNQKELADYTGKDPASIKRTLDILEEKGIVERLIADSDKRAHHLELTTEGKSLIHRLFPVVIDFEARGVSGITGEEMIEFQRVLRKIKENYKTI